MVVEYDYSQDLPALGDNILARISGLTQEAREAEAEIERLEAELKVARDNHKEIVTHRLPALMEEAGQKECTVLTGETVTVCEVLRASIPKGKEAPAHDWLRQNDLGALIKTQVTVEFGKGEEARARSFVERVQNSGLPATVKSAVHSSTLAATLRELVEKGVDFPLEAFGAVIMKEAKITEPKKK